jgi:hypothetical protein
LDAVKKTVRAGGLLGKLFQRDLRRIHKAECPFQFRMCGLDSKVVSACASSSSIPLSWEAASRVKGSL